MGPHVAPPACGEDEALRAAHRLAAILGTGGDRDDAALLFAASGLGALNVPASQNGCALSYETIAHVARIVAAVDRPAAEAIRHHLVLVAAISGTGTRAQQAALLPLVLRGFRFGAPLSGRAAPLRCIDENDAIRILGEVTPDADVGDLPPHLHPLLVHDALDRACYAIVDGDVLAGAAQGASLRVPASRLLPFWKASRPETVQPDPAIRLLLQAAIEAGVAGRAVAERIARLRGGGARRLDPASVESVGGLRLQLDAAIALLEKAGRAVDRAVIRPTPDSVALAQVAAAGARILTAELVRKIGAVDAPARTGSGRHAAARPDPSRAPYALLGAFYLDGTTPSFSC